MTNAIDNARKALDNYSKIFPSQPLGMEEELVGALRDLLDYVEINSLFKGES